MGNNVNMGFNVLIQSDVFEQDAFEIEEGLIDRNLEELDWISSSTEEFVPIISYENYSYHKMSINIDKGLNWKGHLRRYKYESLPPKGNR